MWLWDHTHSDVYAIIITLGAAAPVVSWVVCKLAVLKNVLSLRRDCWEKLIGFVSCLSAQWWHNGQYYEFQKKRSIFFLRNKDFCSDIHYETHLELKCLKPNIDLGVLWLKGAIIVLLETLPCPPASEYWRALEGNGNSSIEDTFHSKVSLGPLQEERSTAKFRWFTSSLVVLKNINIIEPIILHCIDVAHPFICFTKNDRHPKQSSYNLYTEQNY